MYNNCINNNKDFNSMKKSFDWKTLQMLLSTVLSDLVYKITHDTTVNKPINKTCNLSNWVCVIDGLAIVSTRQKEKIAPNVEK